MRNPGREYIKPRAVCSNPTAQASEIQEARDKILPSVCSFGDKSLECGQMEAPRRSLRPHYSFPLTGFLSIPCSFLPVPRSLLFGSCRYSPSQDPPRTRRTLRLSAPGLADSSPGSDLTLASVLSGVDRIVSLLRELPAQDSPHIRAEEGQPHLGLNWRAPPAKSAATTGVCEQSHEAESREEGGGLRKC